MRAAWLVAAALVGCVRSPLVECEDGLSCPAAEVCDELHHGCIAPDQLTACAGLADGADCSAGDVTGGCFDGVCLRRGCGNGIVEPPEQCDDGNQTSGDGCSGDCLSDETCGNGIVDRDLGEECDDGNLMSHDGCDSQCHPEQVAWTIVGLRPGNAPVGLATFDQSRQRLVVPAADAVWELDGSAWSLVPGAFQTYLTYYDPDRGATVGVGIVSGQLSSSVQSWDGTAWKMIAGATPNDDNVVAATYDAARHQPIIIVDHGRPSLPDVWTFDATGTWSLLATNPFGGALASAVIAFDPSTNDVVMLTYVAGSQTEWRYDGATWQATTTPFAGSNGIPVSLTYDPTLGALVAIDSATDNMYERLQGTWTQSGSVTCPEAPGFRSRSLYTTSAGVLTLLTYDGLSICELGTSWQEHQFDGPAVPSGLAIDPKTGRLLVLDDPQPHTGNVSATWTWNGAWQQATTAHAMPSRFSEIAHYDPARGQTIVYGGLEQQTCMDCGTALMYDTWAYDGTDWTQLSSAGPDVGDPTIAVAYDPVGKAVDAFIATEQYGFDATDAAWAMGATLQLPFDNVNSIAWNARDATMIALLQDLNQVGLYELQTDGWTALDLTPTTTFQALVADERAGDIIAMDRYSQHVWELRAGTWTKQVSPPFDVSADHTAYIPADGSIAIVGAGENGTVMLVRAWSSATPMESCVPGEDLDGDGLAGCADPDCYWACTPTCLPYTSCP